MVIERFGVDAIFGDWLEALLCWDCGGCLGLNRGRHGFLGCLGRWCHSHCCARPGCAGVLIPSTLFCGLITVIACCISDFLQAITERDHIAGGRFGGSAFENHTWSRAFAINVKVGIVVDLKCGSV